ncbi:hypothetical protein [Nocardia asteroides]|uniref:hypothetical protein n=1 Tax=Nocardia asteroides TaxID=1824 RepID=UPI003400EE90
MIPSASLAMFAVRPAIPAELYIERFRALISAAVDIAQTVDFDLDEQIALDSLPRWFRDAPDFASTEGANNYVAANLGPPWDPAEWIYCFDPDLRAWTWWDITRQPDGIAVRVDTRGESHIPHGELLWALYVSGARHVDPLRMVAIDGRTK